MKPNYTPGQNIAIKVPSHEFEKTVSFYRDILGLETAGVTPASTYQSQAFKFGDKTLWIDNIATLSQAEVWLEIVAEDIRLAAEHLDANGVIRRDEIEGLPRDIKGFWISSPSNIIHLVTE